VCRGPGAGVQGGCNKVVLREGRPGARGGMSAVVRSVVGIKECLFRE
jgi:hypothetical protein